MEYKVLTQPLTQEEIKSHMNTNGYITETIALQLDNITHLNTSCFLDRLSKAVIGRPFLIDITYTVLGRSDEDELIIQVHGYVLS